MLRIILVTTIITLMFNNIAKAGCESDIDFKWRTAGKKTVLTFKNEGSKFIRITRIYVKDSDGEKVLNMDVADYFKNLIYNPKESKGFVAPGKTWSKEIHNPRVKKYGKTANYRCKYQKPYEKSFSDSVGDTLNSAGNVLDDLNPLNYFERRKMCIKRKDNADTVAIGKRIYKNCMENN